MALWWSNDWLLILTDPNFIDFWDYQVLFNPEKRGAAICFEAKSRRNLEKIEQRRVGFKNDFRVDAPTRRDFQNSGLDCAHMAADRFYRFSVYALQMAYFLSNAVAIVSQN